VVSATDLLGSILDFLDRRRTILPSSSSVVLTGLSEPRFRSATSQKIWYRLELNPGPLDL
jgi:hypothetical protein